MGAHELHAVPEVTHRNEPALALPLPALPVFRKGAAQVRQRPDDGRRGHVGERIEEEGETLMGSGQQPPQREALGKRRNCQEQRRTEREGAVGGTERQAVRLDQLVALDQVGNRRLLGRLEDQGERLQQQIDDDQQSDGLDECQAEHQRRPRHLDDEHHGLAVETIGNDAPHRSEEQAREDARHQSKDDSAAARQLFGQ